MSVGDRITVLVAAGAISATLGMGSCSTNAHLDDLKMQLNRRFDEMNARIDEVNVRILDLQADIRELRTLIVGAKAHDASAD